MVDRPWFIPDALAPLLCCRPPRYCQGLFCGRAVCWRTVESRFLGVVPGGEIVPKPTWFVNKQIM